MAEIVPAHTHVHGATVLTFPADAEDFASRNAAERYLKERGFSVGRWQAGAPAGILHREGVDVRKWRDLSAADQDALVGKMHGDGRRGPITVVINAKTPHAAHMDAAMPALTVRPSRASNRGMTFALIGMFGCLSLLGGMLFLVRPAPVVQRHAAVEQLFRAPKIALRAEALRRLPPELEVRR